MSGYIRTRDKLLLCLRSGNRCAFSKCRKQLIRDRTESDREVITGEIAHICGENPGSARYEPNMSPEARNVYDNLIFLCVEDHTVVDGQPLSYTVQFLRNLKRDHEMWVRLSTEQAMLDVSFIELEYLTKVLAANPQPPSASLVVTTPLEKIRKNDLSDEVGSLIMQGMLRAAQVKAFVESSLDLTFGERLVQGFKQEYHRLAVVEDVYGDDLFYRLWEFASSGSSQFKERAAGLAILAHLFELCEVFEP